MHTELENQMKRALVALDLSPAMEALVTSLPGLLEFGIDELHLVYVAPPVSYPASEAISRAEQARGRLATLRASLESAGFSVRVEVPFGAPADVLCTLAAETRADLIVVGSRSHSRIREAFVGSVAWEVVRKASVPVLLRKVEPVRPDPEAVLEVAGPGLPKRLIFPTDFSEVADRALPWVDWLMDRGVPELVLVHVHEMGDEEARRGARFARRAFRSVHPSGDPRGAGRSPRGNRIRRDSPSRGQQPGSSGHHGNHGARDLSGTPPWKPESASRAVGRRGCVARSLTARRIWEMCGQPRAASKASRTKRASEGASLISLASSAVTHLSASCSRGNGSPKSRAGTKRIENIEPGSA